MEVRDEIQDLKNSVDNLEEKAEKEDTEPTGDKFDRFLMRLKDLI